MGSEEEHLQRHQGLETDDILHVVHLARKTHICHFYEDREDLVEALVPFFKEGLEAGEFCLWGCDAPLPKTEAMAELARAVPNLEAYIERGQLEIFSASDLYRARFDHQGAFARFMDIVKDALRRGFSGFRCDGNTGGVPSQDFLNFMLYEAAVDAGIRPFNITAMCSYPLAKCSVAEIATVRQRHQSVLIKRGDMWEFSPAPGE